MKKTFARANISRKLAQAVTQMLLLVLFICANTNSCGMVYQPEMPSGVAKYSKIK